MPNKIYSILSKDHSKQSINTIVAKIVADPTLLDELMDCFFSEDNKICQRSAGVVEMLGEKHGHLLKRYLPKMYDYAIENTMHITLLRNTLRVFQFMSFDEEMEGKLFEFCFNNSTNLKQPIAVRFFGLKICIKIAKKYPELKNEVLELLNILSIDDTPAMKSAVRKGKKDLK
jgi:hypothetical protein